MRPNQKNADFIAAGGDDFANGNDGERGAGAVTGRGQADRETTPVREPLYRMTDAGRVNRPAANAGDHSAEIEHRQPIARGIDDPAGRHRDAAERDHQFWSALRTEMSTIQPSIGVSHVSSAIKMLKASWIDAIDQPCALLSGLTNSVQPYCRLAISTMQTMTAINCTQRMVFTDVFVPIPTLLATLMFRPRELLFDCSPIRRVLDHWPGEIPVPRHCIFALVTDRDQPKGAFFPDKPFRRRSRCLRGRPRKGGPAAPIGRLDRCRRSQFS